jgi:CobQ-like glutamine amidotransferase family enzyme
MKLTIHHLYADMMNLYGDRGNVIALKKRAEWRVASRSKSWM